MIPIQDARNIFTKAVVGVYEENIPAPSFLRSFFTTKTAVTKEVSIEVRRDTEKIAVDVLRGTDGNRNQFTRHSEKIFVPPFYNEYFDITALERYDRAFGHPEAGDYPTIGLLADEVGGKLLKLRNKIERAKERQCAQVFETGIVELKNGDNIDYKRRAESLVDLGSGGYWSDPTAPVEDQLIAGAKFIRNKGKNVYPELVLVLSSEGWANLKRTNWFDNEAKFVKVTLLDVNMPAQVGATGAVYAGRMTAGAYIYNVYLYDEVYTDETGTTKPYLPTNKAVILPVQGHSFLMQHAGVPAILADTTQAEFNEYIGMIAGEYYVNNYIERKRKAHIFELYSAPLALPVSVDMIYTMQVLA